MTLMIQSWCPGSKCDPCKPLLGNLFITIQAYVHWVNWDYPTHTPITYTATINGAGAGANGSISITGTDLFPGGGNSSPLPLVQDANFGNCSNARVPIYFTSSVDAPSADAFAQYGGPNLIFQLYILNPDGSRTYIPPGELQILS